MSLILPTSARPTEKLSVKELLTMSTDELLVEGYIGFDGPRGFNQLADADSQDPLTHTVDGVELAAMWAEFTRTIQLWNQQRDALTNLLSYRLTKLTETVRYPVEEEFEEASEFGVPKGIRSGPKFRLGFGFKWWDLAIRYTWMYLLDATADELRALNLQALEADNRLQFSKIMTRIFNSAGETATIDGESFNVYPFYNADGTVPPKWKTTTFDGTHTHFLVSGGATIDSGDIDTAVGHIEHHGYQVTRGTSIIILVNQQEGATIRTFNVADGDKFDFIPGPAYGGGVYLPAGTLINEPAMRQFAGLNTIGSYGNAIIVEEDYVPAGYFVTLASGGPDNIGNPVGIREHERASMRGLRLVKGPEKDYPLTESYYLHGFGTGIRHRGAGVVTKIAASGSYSAPTIYA